MLGGFEQVVAAFEVGLVAVGGEDFGLGQRRVVCDEREAAIGNGVVGHNVGLGVPASSSATPPAVLRAAAAEPTPHNGTARTSNTAAKLQAKPSPPGSHSNTPSATANGSPTDASSTRSSPRWTKSLAKPESYSSPSPPPNATPPHPTEALKMGEAVAISVSKTNVSGR